ncbi:hypothetical protein FO519_007530 [Halicephalobus sp. NKZ332]|nr:hypothetical protein FO519_007530 [Halicephalobus sp. NKZ332]
MIRWFLITALFAVLKISSSSESEEYFVGERNGKNYTIKKYDVYPTILELHVNESGGIIKNFSSSVCSEHQISIKNHSINSQGSHLFFHIRNSFHDNYLVTVNLTALSNDTPNGNCMFVNAAYFGKHKIYVYRVENSKILKRWLVSPEGKEVNPIVVAKAESSIKEVEVSVDSINITTKENIHPITLEDAPKCDVPDNNVNEECMLINAAYFGKHKIYVYRTIDSNTLVRQLVTPEDESINGIVVAKTKSWITNVDVSVDSINITIRGKTRNDSDIHISYKDAPKCDVPENDITCIEYYPRDVLLDFSFPIYRYSVGERNGTRYNLTVYYEFLFHEGILILSVKEPNSIVKSFQLKYCYGKDIKMKNYSINSQGTHLFIYALGMSDNKYLITVDLTALSNNTLNGECKSVKGAYFGKHKIYVYRVENSKILKRWLMSPEGKEINPVVVARTESWITNVDVSVDSINITTKENIHPITLEDAPKCDVPDDGTPCDDDKVPEATTQVPLITGQNNTEHAETTVSTNDNLSKNARATKKRRHIASTVEKKTVKSGDNSIVKPSKYDSNIGVIAIGAFALVSVMILVGYFVFNSRSNSKREPQNDPNKGSGNRKLIMKNSPQDKDCKVPMIA